MSPDPPSSTIAELSAITMAMDSSSQRMRDIISFSGQSAFFSKAEILQWYRSDWVFKRACDYIPSLAIKEGGSAFCKADSLSQKDVDWIDDRLTELDVLGKLRDAAQLANRYGGAALLLVTNDGRTYDKPLSSTEPVKVIDLMLTSSYELSANWEIGSSTPESYSLQSWSQGETNQIPGGKIHPSRVLPFYCGSRVFDTSLGSSNFGWPSSLLAILKKPLEDYRAAMCKARELLNEHSMLVHGMAGLKQHGEKFGAEMHKEQLRVLEAKIQNNIQAARTGGYALYDKATESIDYVNRQLSGVYEIVKLQKDELIGSSGLTPGILFNDFASGLNAGGANKSVENSESDIAQKCQRDELGPVMGRIIQVIAQEKKSPIKGRKGLIRWKWNPIDKPDTSGLAESYLKLAQAHKLNIESGVYTQDEARGTYGGDSISFVVSLEKRKAGDEANGPL